MLYHCSFHSTGFSSLSSFFTLLSLSFATIPSHSLIFLKNFFIQFGSIFIFDNSRGSFIFKLIFFNSTFVKLFSP